MAVTTVDSYGAPSYGPIGRPPAGVVYHTPEWGNSPSLEHAIACAKWQATSSNTSGGSYHGILGHDDVKYPHGPTGCTVADHWTMVRSVPWDQAAGGLSTARDATWAPERYPWIKQLISPEAYSDPNRYFHQIALSGKASWYVNNGYPKGAVTRLAEWVKILEGAYKYDAVLTLHRFWQTNRSDPGPVTLADLVLAEYARLNAPAPTPEPTPDYKALWEAEKAKVADQAEVIATLKTKISAAQASLK